MDVNQRLNALAARLDETRTDLARLPLDLEFWQPIQAAGKIGDLLAIADALREASDRARAITAALAWLPTPDASEAQP